MTPDAFRKAAPLIVLAAVLPLGMVPANRGATAFLCAAAALAWFAAGAPARGMAADILRTLREDRLAQAAAALAGFALVSIAWSHDRLGGLRQFGEMLLPLAAFLILARALPRPLPRWAAPLLAVSLILAALVIIADLKYGLPLRRWLNLRDNSFVHNRPAVLLALTLFPLAALMQARGARFWLLPVSAAVTAAALASESGAALTALAAGSMAMLFGLALPRLAHKLGLAALAAAFALAPFAGPVLARIAPERFLEATASMSSAARIKIWQAYSGAVQSKPLAGSGFGSSVTLNAAPLNHGLPPDLGVLLGTGHPHNMVLQVWVELGLSGALAATLLTLALFRRHVRPGHPEFAWRLGFAAAVATVAFVSHGAWQGWFWSIVAAGAVWFGAAEASRRAA